MDRRLIDLEMKMFEAQLHRRNQTLDIPQAERMRYWLAGWKQSYAAGFETDNYRGPDLRPRQCLERIKDLEGYIEDRHKNEDHGHAAQYDNWLQAMKATYRLAGGEGLPDESEDQAGEPETPAQAEEPPSPEAMAKVPLMARKSQVSKLTGKQLPRTADSTDVNQAYAKWYAQWYRDQYGSEYRSQAA